MFLVMMAFWLLLNGRVTAEILLTGAVICGLLYVFLWKFFGCSPRRDVAFFRRVPGFAGYAAFLLGAIIRSAAATMRLIWSPGLVAQPRLVSFRSRLKTGTGRVLLANSITMTPGTITVNIRGDRYLVHCLDSDFAEGLEDSAMERRILRLEDGEEAAGHD